VVDVRMEHLAFEHDSWAGMRVVLWESEGEFKDASLPYGPFWSCNVGWNLEQIVLIGVDNEA